MSHGQDAETGTDPAPSARRSHPWKAAFVILLVLGLLAIAVWLLLGSRLLVVRETEVSGLERLDPEEVTAALSVPTGTPLARVDTEEAGGRVEELRLVEHAQVRRGWPATLRIEVAERVPVLSVSVEDGYQLVDHDGVRIEDTEERPDNRPLVAVRGEIEGNAGVAAAAAIVEELDDDVLAQVEAIDAADLDDIGLELQGGAEVVWGDERDPGGKARILAVLTGEHPVEDGREYDVASPEVAVVR